MGIVRPPLSLVLVLCAAAVLVVCLAPGFAAEEENIHLSFAPPEGLVLKYKTSQMNEQNFAGMDITYSHSMMVDLSLKEKTEEGSYKVALYFSEEDASLFRDGTLEDYEPNIVLEGKTAFVIVNSKGEVTRADAASHIQGLSSEEELREMVEDWFIKLPDADVTVGQEWRIDILKMGVSQEGEEPEVKGYTDFKLKKIEEKDGLLIAEIEGKRYVDINRAMQFGRVIAEGKGEIKTKIAVEGGYIIECKRKMDVKGTMVGQDPITGRESESKTAITQYFECKLEK
jgi:hypothetical protein